MLKFGRCFRSLLVRGFSAGRKEAAKKGRKWRMPLEVRVRDGRGRPWELFQFKDEERDVATEFMDDQVAAGHQVKMHVTKGTAQGGSERHRDPYRRPMRAAGCFPG